MSKQTIIQGDCLEVMKTFADKSFDLVLTDPPYGLDFQYDDFTDTKESLKSLVARSMPEMLRVGKIVALTPGIGNTHLYPPPDWMMAWFYRGGANYSSWGFNCWQPILVYGKDPYLRDRLGCRADTIEDNIPAKKDFGHPCPKPISVIEKMVTRFSTKESDLILDPFMGSGTTLVAAKYLNRNATGIEISEKYCGIARMRLRQEVLF